MTFRLHLSLLAALTSGLLGCALTSKSDPFTVRYFTPEASGGEQAGAAHANDAAAAPGPRLRLGRISAASYLREAIAYRSSSRELGYYEDRRWTESPDIYLRRALARALYEERGLTRVVSGGAPTLEVELTAFEEIQGKPRSVRIQAVVLLHDRGLGQLQRTITLERPVEAVQGDALPSAIVDALSQCLELAVRQISDWVVAALPKRESHATRIDASPQAQLAE